MTLSTELMLAGLLCLVGLPFALLVLVGAIAWRVASSRSSPATPAPLAPVTVAAAPPAGLAQPGPAAPMSHVVIEHRGLQQPAQTTEPTAASTTPQHVQAFEVVLPGSFTATLRPKE